MSRHADTAALARRYVTRLRNGDAHNPETGAIPAAAMTVLTAILPFLLDLIADVVAMALTRWVIGATDRATVIEQSEDGPSGARFTARLMRQVVNGVTSAQAGSDEYVKDPGLGNLSLPPGGSLVAKSSPQVVEVRDGAGRAVATYVKPAGAALFLPTTSAMQMMPDARLKLVSFTGRRGD